MADNMKRKFAANPFAKLHPDADKGHSSRPIISPATFMPNFGGLDRSSTSSSNKTGSEAPTSSAVFLRPSALSSKTQNLGKGLSSFSSNSKTELTEEKSDEPKNFDDPGLSVDSTSTSSDDTKEEKRDGKISSSSVENNESESLKETNDNSQGASSFVFGNNIGDRVCGVPTVSNGPKEADNPPASTSSTNPSGAGFVFGQNLAERVAGTPVSPEGPAAASKDTDSTVTNSFQTVVTSSSAASADSSTETKNGENGVTSPNKTTLEESASAYQAKLAKQEFEEVHVVTGEEDESNVLQINCKLYMFEKDTHNWLERGRGLLRLNDKSTDAPHEAIHSRIVMRTHGTFCVILNTQLWSGMLIEKSSPKSIRITAQSEDGIRVFVIMAGPKDVDNLFGAVDWRVQQLKMEEEEAQASSSSFKRAADEDQEQEDDIEPETKKQKLEPSGAAAAASQQVIVDPQERRDVVQDDSNDSSSLDPDASNESSLITSSCKDVENK